MGKRRGEILSTMNKITSLSQEPVAQSLRPPGHLRHSPQHRKHTHGVGLLRTRVWAYADHPWRYSKILWQHLWRSSSDWSSVHVLPTYDRPQELKHVMRLKPRSRGFLLRSLPAPTYLAAVPAPGTVGPSLSAPAMLATGSYTRSSLQSFLSPWEVVKLKLQEKIKKINLKGI